MEKLYTENDYANKACEANLQGKMLYRVVKDVEYEVDVPEFNIVGYEDCEQQIEDEQGNIRTEIIKIPIQEPIMIEEVNENNEKCVYQQTHKETRVKTVEVLEIRDAGYYICSSENITNGTLNENYESDKALRVQARVDSLTMTALDFIGVLQGFGLPLEEINNYLENNLEIKMQLMYCQNVYCGIVKRFLPITIAGVSLTVDMIEQAFKVKNGFENV